MRAQVFGALSPSYLAGTGRRASGFDSRVELRFTLHTSAIRRRCFGSHSRLLRIEFRLLISAAGELVLRIGTGCLAEHFQVYGV